MHSEAEERSSTAETIDQPDEGHLGAESWETLAEDAARASSSTEGEPQPESEDAEAERAPEAEPTLAARLDALEAAVRAGFAASLEAIDDRRSLERAKDEQLTRLHDELQDYKRDRFERAKRPLVLGIIRMHDDLGKVIVGLDDVPPAECDPRQALDQLKGFAEDLELFLGQHGVEPFHATGDAFDPRLQTALRTEPADDPERVGHVVARLRPGFQQGETILQKERVTVLAATERPRNESESLEGGET